MPTAHRGVPETRNAASIATIVAERVISLERLTLRRARVNER